MLCTYFISFLIFIVLFTYKTLTSFHFICSVLFFFAFTLYSSLFLANALTKLFPVLVEFKKVHVASFPPAAPVPAITAAAAVTTKGKSKGKSLNNETLQQQQQQQQQQGLLTGSVHQMEEV